MIKKAQGSLEFLMTYGIAIVAIVAVIGLLYEFNFFNPCRFTGALVSGVPFNMLITNPKFDTNQNLSLKLKSVGMDNVGIVAMNGTYAKTGSLLPSITSASARAVHPFRHRPHSSGDLGFNGTIIPSGAVALLNMSSVKPATGWSVGSCYTAKISIIYNLSSDTTPRNYSMLATIEGPVQS